MLKIKKLLFICLFAIVSISANLYAGDTDATQTVSDSSTESEAKLPLKDSEENSSTENTKEEEEKTTNNDSEDDTTANPEEESEEEDEDEEPDCD